MHQGELAGSCLLSYLTLSREVDRMLGPGEPKNGEGVSTVKGHRYPSSIQSLFPSTLPISSLSTSLVSLSSHLPMWIFSFLSRNIFLLDPPLLPSLCSLKPSLSYTLVGTFRFGRLHTAILSLYDSNLNVPWPSLSHSCQSHSLAIFGHSRVTAAHTNRMQTGTMETVLAEPRLTQGEIFPFIVAGS